LGEGEAFGLREVAVDAVAVGELSHCPHCGGKLKSTISQTDDHLFCHLCGQLIELITDARAENAEPVPKRGPTLANAMGLIWPGVLTFPLKRGARGRLIGLSIVFAVAAWLVETAFAYAYFGGGSVPEVLAGVCLFLVAVLPAVAGVNFLAAVLLAILEDTAWGNDDDIGWPTGVWIDWFQRVMMLINAVTFAAVPGIVMATALQLDTPPFYLATGGSLFLLLPIALLSLEENNSMSQPFSREVYKFIVRSWWLWVLFYLLTAVIVAVVYSAAWILAPGESLAKMFVAATAVVTGSMIYFRMLGRLARA
ncbi:MAG: hypothetical protein VB853_10885, partial [Pirellulales bacterium]